MPYTLGDPLATTPTTQTQVTVSPQTAPSITESYTNWCKGNQALCILDKLLHTAGFVAGVYHGYKRNKSIGWALGWGLLGGIFPYITIPVSLAQGFGKLKGTPLPSEVQA